MSVVFQRTGAGLVDSSLSVSSHLVEPASETLPHRTRIERLILLLLLLGVELILLTLPFYTRDTAPESFWHRFVLNAQQGVRPVFITSLAATMFFSWSVMVDELRRVSVGRPERGCYVWVRWLIVHLALAAVLAIGTGMRGAILPVSAAGEETWWLLWAALALGAFLSWGLAILPARFWIGWIGRGRLAFTGGAVLGWIAYVLGNYSQSLWDSLQRSTFAMVVLILKAVGRNELIVDGSNFVIGTRFFTVRISPQCSGFEGIGLIAAALAVYFWFYRRELRFPRAFLLLPIGIASIWLLNSVRIAALILICDSNADAAVKGFHSVAGWLFFNLVACGLVWVSSSKGFFTKARSGSSVRHNPAAPYLMPLIVIIATSMITRTISDGFDFLYPLRVIAAGTTIWLYRGKMASIRWRLPTVAISAGAVVFALWILVVSDQPDGDASIAATLAGAPRFAVIIWLTFRTLGSVITVPIAEELAFRGYVLRKLIDSDFEKVGFGQFTWLSFLGSSILFGMLHGEWLAGIAAGMIFAATTYHRSKLSDAVCAHVTSNLLLSVYVLLFHKWSLWT
jgi:exosortase E/protease (VPEID-CTERM system)